MTWLDAVKFCELTGGHLASLQHEGFMNIKVINFINKKKLHSGFWLGASIQNNSTWKWTDETEIFPENIFLMFT